MSFLNNKFMDGLGKAADMVIISILWILACMPIFTVVPATIALYYATVKVVRRQAGYPLQDFWTGLRQNLRQGMILNVLCILLGMLFYTLYDFAKAAGLASFLGRFYLIFLVVMIVIFVCIIFYLLPVISRFQLSLFQAVRLSLYLGVRNLLTMIPMLFTLLGAGIVVYLFPPALLLLPAVYCFLMSFSVEKALVSYINDHMDNPQQYVGMWYMDE